MTRITRRRMSLSYYVRTFVIRIFLVPNMLRHFFLLPSMLKTYTSYYWGELNERTHGLFPAYSSCKEPDMSGGCTSVPPSLTQRIEQNFVGEGAFQ